MSAAAEDRREDQDGREERYVFPVPPPVGGRWTTSTGSRPPWTGGADGRAEAKPFPAGRSRQSRVVASAARIASR